MAQKWNAYPSRPASGPPRPAPETITAIARRYYSCAVALSTVMGLPLTERFLQDHHAAIACTFIESGRAGVRLPGGVSLPPLMPKPLEPAPEADLEFSLAANENSGPGRPLLPDSEEKVAEALGVSDRTGGRDLDPTANVAPEPPLPVVVPEGLPCAGALIVDLRPPQLSLLLGKVAALAENKDGAWSVLWTALRNERQARLANGRKRPVTPGPDRANDVPG